MRFVREHWMLVAAAVVAVASMLLVPPDGEYLGYFDWQTIGCLFCVLAVAKALHRIGAFDRIARTVVERNRHPRMLTLAIIVVTAAFSMAFTNDVALIIMLPVSATVLVKLELGRLVPPMFALQALAANLCGMITPFGSPQNLYLYSRYQLDLGEFLLTMAVPFVLSLAAILICTWLVATYGGTGMVRYGSVGTGEVRPRPRASTDASTTTKQPVPVKPPTPPKPKPPTTLPFDPRRFWLYCALFVVALLAVFRVIPVAVAVIIIAVVLAFADPHTLIQVDYALLATFVCFFIFAGNVSRIPELGLFLGSLMDGWGLLVSALTSQVISNVPAAVILSHFTDAWQPLLVGVNIGGAGTFVGSLASLIAIRYFALSRRAFAALREPGSPTMGKFLVTFGVLNMAFFAGLLVVCQFIYG